MQAILALGVTGKIGKYFLRILKKFPKEFQLIGFSYHKNFSLAKKIQEEFSSLYVASYISNKEEIAYWKKKKVSFFSSLEELIEEVPYDQVLFATSGISALSSLLKALEKKGKILLANKESLVLGGEIIQKKQKKAPLIPIDSEHNSLFRLLEGNPPSSIQKYILTASGGAIRDIPLEKIPSLYPKDLLKHPNWDMGDKITIDSSTMVNKVLEIAEAHFLFQIPYKKIFAYLHPESIIHALIQKKDGSFFSHLYPPNMEYPIAHALFYPKEVPIEIHPQNSPLFFSSLHFQEIPPQKYPLYYLGRKCLEKGPYWRIAFSLLNEEIIHFFLY